MSDVLNAKEARPQPPRDSEWLIRYRVLGPSAVWEGMTVCEILTGPEAGTKRVLSIDTFVESLERTQP